MLVSIKPQFIKQVSNNNQANQFFWYQYSPRCACIVAEDFNTVFYFGFQDPKEALAFTQAIQNKHCNKAEIRKPKRFDSPSRISSEVKVWGMKETMFLNLVKRDLDTLQQKASANAV